MWIRKISLAACLVTLTTLAHPLATAAMPVLAKDPVQLPIEIEVVSADGKPVADASLTITQEASAPNLHHAAILAQGKSDAEGKFRTTVTSTTNHYYQFSVIADSKQSGIGIGAIGGDLTTDSAATATIKITLQPPVSAKLRVLQPDGSPAANLKLFASGCFRQSQTRSMRDHLYVSVPTLPGLPWQAQTDAQGYCEITNLPPGNLIYLQHDNPSFAQLNHLHYPAKWFDITKENTIQLNLASTVTGQIRTPDGTPVSDAGIFIIEETPYTTAYGASVFTDAEGRFVFPQVPASDYKLTVHVPRHHREEWIGPQKLPVTTKPGESLDLKDLPLTKVAIVTARALDSQTDKEIVPPFHSYLPAGSHEIYFRSKHLIPSGYEALPSRTSIHVTVKEGERQTVDFKLKRADPASLVTGTVFDPAGKPEHNATIVLAGIWSREFPTHQTTDANGQFSIVPPKDAKSLKLYAVGKNKTLSHLTDTALGSSTDVHLKVGGFPSIRGKVTNDLNQPIKGAQLQWDRDGLSFLFVGPPNTTQTDHEGNYEFPRLWAGETYTLNCRIEGHGGAYQKDIQPKEGETITLNFTLPRATESLSGVVLDSTGKPVAKAWVNGYGENQADLHAQTDDQGRFHIKQAVPGSITLRYGINNEDLHVEASRKVTAGQQDLQLVLPESKGSLGGLIVDPSDKPLPHAKLWSNGRTLAGGENGKFQLKGIKPGWHDLDVTVSDGTRGARTKRFRIKTGMNDLRLVVPDQQPAELPYSEQAPNMIGKPAPALNFALWIRGAPYSSEPTPGKVRIIDFWNTQCGPCIAAFPKIETFLNKNKHPELEFIALHAPNPDQEVREFFESRPKLTFPVAISPEDSHNSLNYGVRGNPCYVVIDKSGKIVSHGHDWNATTKAALTALQSPSPPPP